ncbi:NifU family protein [Paenibacillus bouchesdurhonensis]|uniref:NifU family protein n=1 Tax=Paenibacillus bouchesdurhonensis TaxID=1870990 RepID=UPI000DA63830|nr:NifU family protein [Paenibacillus bouchesdurhonensis]
MELVKQIEDIIMNEIRPMTRVDGGDVVFEGFEDNTIILGAYGDCASCPCVDPELNEWIRERVSKRFGMEFRVKINKHIPYYAR